MIVTMKELEIFKWLPEEALNKISNEAWYMIFQDNELIIKDKSKNDDCVYIITSGWAEIIIWNKIIKKLWRWDIFGELAFLTWKERTWTVKAKWVLKVIRFNKKALVTILWAYPSGDKLKDIVMSRVSMNKALFNR